MKKVTSILLVVFSLIALIGCGGKTENMQKEIEALKQSLAELQATVSTQSEQIGTLQGEKTAQAEKIAELEAAKAAQAETIAALQNSANLSAEEIAALEAQLAEQGEVLDEMLPRGAFCSLQTAYANGWITDNALDQIAFYYYYMSDLEAPTNPQVTQFVNNSNNLDPLTLHAMKKTYIEAEAKDWWKGTTRTVNDICFGGFYGKYGNCFVIKLNASLLPNQTTFAPHVRDEKIGNKTFKQYHESRLYVWYPVE